MGIQKGFSRTLGGSRLLAECPVVQHPPPEPGGRGVGMTGIDPTTSITAGVAVWPSPGVVGRARAQGPFEGCHLGPLFTGEPTARELTGTTTVPLAFSRPALNRATPAIMPGTAGRPGVRIDLGRGSTSLSRPPDTEQPDRPKDLTRYAA
jgi:hypothetical protein